MRYDFSMIRGSTFALALIARDKDGGVIDLTGATIDWRFGRRGTKGELSLTDGIAVTDATNGAFTITIAPAKTADVRPTLFYEHQGEVTESGGTVTTVIDGFVEIRKDFT